TVGTVTEIYDYLRLLFANIGVPHCSNCGKEITSQSLERICDMVMLYPQDERINVLAPMVRGRKGEFKKQLAGLRARGFTQARLLVQVAARRLSRLPGAGLDGGLRPAARRAGRVEVAGGRRHRSVVARRSQAGARGAPGAVPRLRHRSECAVRATASQIARGL